jgi:hypothetical protein
MHRLDLGKLAEPERAAGTTVLVVGRPGPDTAGHLRRLGASVVVSPAPLDAALLARVAPQAVAFPLMGRTHDATQVLGVLDACGFGGEAIILAPPLPNRGMVARELAACAPRVRLTLVEARDA